MAPRRPTERVMSHKMTTVQSCNGYGTIVTRDQHAEFYGCASTSHFLEELHSRVRSMQNGNLADKQTPAATAPCQSPSARRYLATSSWSGSVEAENPAVFDWFRTSTTTAEAMARFPCDGSRSFLGLPDYQRDPALGAESRTAAIEIEKECIRSYFANLHLIYFCLDMDAFLAHCESEVWKRHLALTRQRFEEESSSFFALYDIVVALGALVAGPEDHVTRALDKMYRQHHASSGSRVSPFLGRERPPHLTLPLARKYFLEAKARLGSLMGASSLEVIRASLLVSVYCQYAFIPHQSYMFGGIAARTALAMGSASQPDLQMMSVEAIRTWW
ncbi:uncharacterized protein Z520_05535 [Fonsecaea multimorphosa CBS 102226]|uniref:Transcription factor domain-containing protein n=1 Tax=Fonsecaea multimorphosa CBS 102226 TaxID=1442371 RepID=A0A0D2K7C4_9EURO|nr:uncharacterized protein Z520_05535 [Fonsecaea multimorphosa CBS 102226]KIX99074.1 hypothetical protein Z520_05535 [Fonsecaea multimorphosa CBS 102226]